MEREKRGLSGAQGGGLMGGGGGGTQKWEGRDLGCLWWENISHHTGGPLGLECAVLALGGTLKVQYHLAL